MIAAMRSEAGKRGEDVWLVGGAVRDLLLERSTRDLDVVASGDAGEFAKALGERLGARQRIHARFGTATLELPAGVRVDVARPRRESYARPGALPDVAFPATLEEDLARRDFTIHAMALPVTRRAALSDPFAGREDLAARRVRVIHERSFLDDPTRAFRAVRYASRLGFRIEAASERLIAESIREGAVDGVSGDRLWRELSLILGEPERARSAALLARLGVDSAVAPAFARPGAATRIRAAAAAAARLGAVDPDPLCYLLAWMGDAPQGRLVEAADRLALAGRIRETWLAWPETLGRAAAESGFARLPRPERSRRVRGLSPSLAAAVAATLSAPDRAAWIAAVRAPRATLRIRGGDLVAAGVSPGPRVGEALARTLEAREDGVIRAEQELEFAVAAARRNERQRP